MSGLKNFLMQGQLILVAVGTDGLPLEATKCRYCATELTVEQSGGLAEPA